ncbi:large subunit GTPase 1-like [Arachis ipaensis]|uniref:large subunit GTPase 1-like n=1 Tax=Arachis ipaensis TaxID=130454 RepID=UPI000A2B7DB0|nr:large subunit GTPase 1-like [Arachis ipaensis]
MSSSSVSSLPPDLLTISFYVCIVRICCRCMSVLLLSPPVYVAASLSPSPSITGSTLSSFLCLFGYKEIDQCLIEAAKETTEYFPSHAPSQLPDRVTVSDSNTSRCTYLFIASLPLHIKKTIIVSVIGLPNVGKSSLINSLKRAHVVNVGATPGLTRSMQEVQLDKNIKLLDCPGVVMLKSLENDASVALLNCKRIEKLDDPISLDIEKYEVESEEFSSAIFRFL